MSTSSLLLAEAWTFLGQRQKLYCSQQAASASALDSLAPWGQQVVFQERVAEPAPCRRAAGKPALCSRGSHSLVPQGARCRPSPEKRPDKQLSGSHTLGTPRKPCNSVRQTLLEACLCQQSVPPPRPCPHLLNFHTGRPL